MLSLYKGIKLSIALGRKGRGTTHSLARVFADILLATDPDCDRVGVGDGDGRYTLLTGDEIGLLLLEYICRQKQKNGTMPKHPVAVKTVVTTDLATRIAEAYGVHMSEVLTGFKYIGEYIGALEAAGREDDFILGFEESCGYLTAGYVRDKDGVLASMLVCELALYYKKAGKTLCGAIQDIYSTYGYCKNTQGSYTFAGPEGGVNMRHIMTKFRSGIATFGGEAVVKVQGFKEGIMGLPKSDVLKIHLADNSTIVVRPSGTEPKLKVYFSVNATDERAALKRIESIASDVENIIRLTSQNA